MREQSKPSDIQLRKLYEAAIDFKKAEPWKYLYDADIICVENPADGSIGYCSVMGQGGEHFALGVYLGDRGIFGFYNVMYDADKIPANQILHQQDCIMCSFEDRGQLASEDRKQIKDLGFTFRGRNAWPMFRRFEPGYFPWFLNQEECIFLTHAIRQTLFVIDGILAGDLQLNMENGQTVLRYSRTAAGTLKWQSKEMEVLIPHVQYHQVRINDELLFQKIKKAGRTDKVSLQIDICYMYKPVQEKKGDRPYFPRAFIMTDRHTGLILDYEIFGNIKEDIEVAINKIINLCFERGIPDEIQIRSERMEAILGDFCQKAGIKLKLVKRLSHIDRFLKELAIHG